VNARASFVLDGIHRVRRKVPFVSSQALDVVSRVTQVQRQARRVGCSGSGLREPARGVAICGHGVKL